MNQYQQMPQCAEAPQKFKRKPASNRLGLCAEVAWPKKGDVCTPEKAPRFVWFKRLNAWRYNSRRNFLVPLDEIDGGAAPSPGLILTILTCGPPVCFSSGPNSRLQLNRDPISQRPAPRALFRPTPSGRSLITVSPLLSKPVVMLYGSADVALRIAEIANPLINLLLKNAFSRCLKSLDEGPRSARRFELFEGRLNGPSASLVFFINK